MLILGIMQVIGALGILAHRAWGRAFGVVLGLLGTIAGIGMILSAIDLERRRLRHPGHPRRRPVASWASPSWWLICYAFIFLTMFAGRRHFRRKGVS